MKYMAAQDYFKVHVGEQELLRPEKPTLHEFKYLSNIDDQSGIRNHIPFIHFYLGNTGAYGDQVSTLRCAVSRALVHYYPLAGRLRSADGGKLVVDCCSEGVVFREADANITLSWLRTANGSLRPPVPQLDRLLVDDVWGCNIVTDSPLLRMQFTRFICGGFAIAYTFNHCACDAFGALQFVTAVAEFARDPTRLAPTAPPSWGRETLKPRRPPRVSYPHPEYDTEPTPVATESDFKRHVQTSTFFTHEDISALKRQIDGQRCPTFDAVASCLWRARTRALRQETDEGGNISDMARLLFPIDTRSRHRPALPKGYYGSAVVFPCAAAPASDICDRPIRHTAGLISALKSLASGDDYRASVVDFLEANARPARPGFVWEGAFVVSDMSRLRFAEVDFGWGRGVYGGPARAGTGAVPGMVTSVVGHRREEDGAEGLLALVSLPREAVERFERAVRAEIKSGEDVTSIVVAKAAL